MGRKLEPNPLNRDPIEYAFQKAPRCSAMSKRTRERCKARRCEDGVFAASMVREAELRRAKQMALGRMVAIASNQKPRFAF